MKCYSSLIGFALVSLIPEKWTNLKPCTTLERQRNCNAQVQSAFKKVLNYMKMRSISSFMLTNSDQIVKPGATDVSMFRRHSTDSHVHSMEMGQAPFDRVSKIMINKCKISEGEKSKYLTTFTAKGKYSNYAKSRCKSTRGAVICKANYPYRAPGGKCNNLKHTNWGSINTCYRRLLPAYYERASGLRLGKDGNPLPDPRTLSLNIHMHINSPKKKFSHMYVYFGQLLAHDISMTPISTIKQFNGAQAIQCCPRGIKNHPQCAPIKLSDNDPFYSNYGVRCQNFVRSSLCPTCKLGVRQQMNQVTSFIDASFVYGNSRKETKNLRKFRTTGRLRVQITDAGELLPRAVNSSSETCVKRSFENDCFLAGDPRVNQHTVLATLQTLFMREHNRVAKELIKLNPHWKEEKIFQEARRIVGAEMQVITYNEYLPITVGDHYMAYYNLYIKSKETTEYDPEINPSIYTEFSTAAFRFGHSLINSWVLRGKVHTDKKDLSNDFVQPFDIYKRGKLEHYFVQATHLPSQSYDPHLVPDVTNLLFREPGEDYGLDLASFDIQRGRDHGLPPYTKALKACFREKIFQSFTVNDFADLTYNNLMLQENMELLKNNYRHVDDIDMWTGILSESPLRKSAVGPTAACIIALQFHKLKFGDRFYFEHRNQAGSFTPQQVEELKKTTLSSIICHNTKLKKMHKWAMQGKKNNPNMKCEDFPTIDFSLWKE